MSIYLRRPASPYQVTMLFIAALGGLELIIRGRGVAYTPDKLDWSLYLLGGSLVLTSGVALLGVLMSVRGKRVAGLYVERAGLIAQVLLLSVYSAMILTRVGPMATVTVTFFSGFVVSGIWRVWLIRRQTREAMTSLVELAAPGEDERDEQ